MFCREALVKAFPENFSAGVAIRGTLDGAGGHAGVLRSPDVSPITPGPVVAYGTRSTILAYGAGAVVKVPAAATPESWIRFEASYAEAARTSGAPVARLLGIERID